MNASEILENEDFKKCESFHGHICPGLSIGYRAAIEAMTRLSESRSEDEEVVAIVETDACSADAVQVLTGCTFGKGNFIYKDYGKMVLTLLSRRTGRGVRVALRHDAFKPDEVHMSLLKKGMSGDANEAEKKQFQTLNLKRSFDVLEMPTELLFNITAVEMSLPENATIEPSEPCARCGEPTMRTKLEIGNGEKVCRGCVGF
jgi:formylmethanofuran dehydrogenase subunit E